MMPYYIMQQQLEQRAAHPPPPPVVVGSKFLPLWTATTTSGGGLVLPQEESSRVPYPPLRRRHALLGSPPPRFYQLDTDLEKLARYPPGCPVVARLDNKNKNNNNNNNNGTQILVDVVDTVHVDLVTNAIHYQLACHQYHHHHHHHEFIPEQALRFGYGAPVWMRQQPQQQGTSSQRVAAQIVATTTTAVVGEEEEEEEGETYYAAQVIGWSLNDDTDKEMTTTTIGVTHHNIPGNQIVYRETLSPLSRVVAPDCSCSVSCRIGTNMTTPTTTMTTNTSHSSTTSDADTRPVRMEAAISTDMTAETTVKNNSSNSNSSSSSSSSNSSSSSSNSNNNNAEKNENHELSPDDNPLQNMMDWLSSLEQQQQEDEQEGNHEDDDNDRQGDVPQVVEFDPRMAPQQQPEPADTAMTNNHTAPSPVTVSSSAATTIATTSSTTTTNTTTTTTNTTTTNPITPLTVDHDSVTQPQEECTEDVAAPRMPAASAAIIKSTTDTTSKDFRESGWLKIACDLQTVPTSTWKTTKVKLNVPPDTTFGIPIWAVTPQMKALFKTKKAILEKKHKCTLDLTNNSTGTHGHDKHVWTIGIYFKTNMNKYPQKRDIVTQVLWHTLYDLVFAHAKDENEHENLCLAYDLACENPHMYPPAAQQQPRRRRRRRGSVGNKNGSAKHDMLGEHPPIVWQHEGSSQKPKCWMTVLDTYATHHKAVAVLVGPGGLGMREIKGSMLPGVFVCALERPRVGIFLAGDSVQAVQDSLLRARHRLAWAKQRAPRLFGSCLSDTAPETKTDKDKE